MLPNKVKITVSLRNSVVIDGGVFYGPQRKFNFKVDKSYDLPAFQNGTILNSVAEFSNTIDDKDNTNFNITNKTNVIPDFNDMLFYDAFFKSNSFNTVDEQQEVCSFSYDLPQNGLDTMNYPYSHEFSTSEQKMSPLIHAVQESMGNVNINANTRQCSSSLFIPDQQQVLQAATEASERSFTPTTMRNHSFSLDLAFTDYLPADISTPDIIHQLCNPEGAGFNILDLENNDNLDISNVSPSCSTSINIQSCQKNTLTITNEVPITENNNLDIEINSPYNISKSVQDFKCMKNEETSQCRKSINKNEEIPLEQVYDDLSQYIELQAPVKQHKETINIEVFPSTSTSSDYQILYEQHTENGDDDDIAGEPLPNQISISFANNSSRLVHDDSKMNCKEKPVKRKSKSKSTKKVESVSSDCFDSDSNQESTRKKTAAQKARIEKKRKDEEREKELNDLITKNMKLKVHVKSLEDQVNFIKMHLFK